jgi:uncharacterized cupin superfamily protein
MTQEEKAMNKNSLATESILITTPATEELEPEPIPPEWIVSGSPVARCKKVIRSHDRTSHIVVWDCTPGSFRWYYGMDEAIMVVSGEAFMIDEQGRERRFGPGDLGFFPAGTSCTWRITETLRKVGVLKESMWRPLGLCVKGWHKILRIVGLAGKSALMLTFAFLALKNLH